MSSAETLPLEVLEAVIGLSDAEDARSLALTSKALLPSSRANIFSYVVLTASDRHMDIPRLFDLLERSPNLEPFIRHLTIINLHDIALWSSNLVGVLDRLQHLKTLSIVHAKNYFGCEWGSVNNIVQNAILKCVLSETLEAVDAQFFEYCIPFLQGCPKLKHLDLYSPREALTRHSHSSPPIVLESLRVSTINEPPFTIDRLLGTDGDPLLDLSQLKTLVCDSRADYCDIVFGRWIAQMAKFSGSSLSELYWDVNTPELKSNDLLMSLNLLPQLQTLSIICRYNPHAQDPEDGSKICCTWIGKLMQSRQPAGSLSSSVFRVPWSDNPGPLRDLITTIEGAQSATFCFDNFPSPNNVPEENDETMEILFKASRDCCGTSITIKSPTESYSPLQDLRSKRPFTRIPLDSPWF
ncbi:hypothetical protein DL96DRAFT_1590803 [Flagelloscypha sp. PMI_526]|nr:hypothetical protein DL96DRAFT_1590803 [Flagelloscypha sp. PMI_526]